MALREIADETIAPDDLKEQLIHSLQKYVEVDEPEAETVPLLGNTAAAPAVGSDNDADIQFDRMSEEDLLRGLEGLVPLQQRRRRARIRSLQDFRGKPGSRPGFFLPRSPGSKLLTVAALPLAVIVCCTISFKVQPN